MLKDNNLKTLTDSHKRWIFVIFFVALISLTIFMIKDFLMALLTAGLIAYLLHPLYIRLIKSGRSRTLAASILSLLSIVLLVMLAFLFMPPMIEQTQILYHNSDRYMAATEQYFANKVPVFFPCPEIPTGTISCSLNEMLTPVFEDGELRKQVVEITKSASSYFTGSVSRIIGELVDFSIFIVILIFAIFYFLDNGTKIKRILIEIIPLKAAHKDMIIKKVQQTVHAVIVGNISMALLQGIVASILFFAFGFRAPLLLGLLLAVLAFLPMIGPTIIWIPAAIVLLAEGHPLAALLFAALSATFLGLIENFLKPIVIGDRMKLSAFIVFLGVIGGIKAFGVIGLFLGPILLALVTTSIKIYREDII
ncbi:MAG TPA: AI-2E family transporter [Candidatus Nanoarchaeia archaeon]|nr:AI-2E family transporter [Candidatus Nanoarchaeia archaeon]